MEKEYVNLATGEVGTFSSREAAVEYFNGTCCGEPFDFTFDVITYDEYAKELLNK